MMMLQGDFIPPAEKMFSFSLPTAKEVRERLTQLPKDPTPSDEHDDLTKVLLRRNDYWCDIVLHLHDTPPTVLPPNYILDEDKHPPAPKPEINNENSFVYGYSHHFAPLMVDCERCDLCHQPEMTEARVRLLCIHGEVSEEWACSILGNIH